MVIQGVFGRAAKAIVANIAAIVFLTDGAKNRYRPMVVAVDGSLFRYSTLLRPAVSEELDAFLVQKHQRYCVCKPGAERLRHRHGRRIPAAGLIQGRKSGMSQTSGFLRLSGDDLTNMAQNHAMSGETFASGPCSFLAPFRTCGFI